MNLFFSLYNAETALCLDTEFALVPQIVVPADFIWREEWNGMIFLLENTTNAVRRNGNYYGCSVPRFRSFTRNGTRTGLIWRFLAFLKHVESRIDVWSSSYGKVGFRFSFLGTRTPLPFLFLRMGSGIRVFRCQEPGAQLILLITRMWRIQNVRTDSLSIVVDNLLKFIRRKLRCYAENRWYCWWIDCVNKTNCIINYCMTRFYIDFSWLCHYVVYKGELWIFSNVRYDEILWSKTSVE